ncbi:sugar ABC transporter substrate-binding protein [Bellilinea sp.]|uniref:sugar ABC transporter substrate-binding protein n=1 Tax=Bellilinea sp. TaxID=2838785 RepID=UPI002ADD3681|nr:substrate-binding domain-containing protein [Bellilinea sp.]
MKINVWQKGFFLAILVMLLTACAGPAPSPNAPAQSQTKTIAVVTPYMANETTKYVIDRFKSEAEAKGWRVTVTDTAGDFNLLVSRIQDAVAQKVDAIVLGMGDPAQMTQGLEAASKANIPVFGIDAGNAPGVLVNVTSDNASLGKLSAETLVKAIGAKGNVVMFTHDPHPGVRARAAAAAEVFSAYPEIQVIEKKHIEVPGPLDNARKITEDLLTAYPESGSIAGIWAGWDEPALGAVQAMLAAGRNEIKVVGIDGTDFAKAEIKKQGPFIASVAQDFDAMAAKTTEIMEAYFNGVKPQSESVLIPGLLLTAENIK